MKSTGLCVECLLFCVGLILPGRRAREEILSCLKCWWRSLCLPACLSVCLPVGLTLPIKSMPSG